MLYNNIGVNITTFGRKLPLFLRISIWGNMRSSQRQVELRRLGNQLPVLRKANSLCEVGNISLQFDRVT